ncbi:MAG: hypothetical protein ACKVP4_03790 [Hyphomicrobium sp.]
MTDHEEVVAIGGRAKGFDKNAVACGVVGFFAGALAWHLVGFWSFVSAIAFNGDVGSAPPVALARNSASQEVKTSDIVTGSITSSQIPTSADCVALAIDRHKRNFEKTACPQTSLPFRHNDQSEKGDRLTDATDVGHGDPPPEVPAASETDAGAPVNAPAVEGDFDLQLRPGP